MKRRPKSQKTAIILAAFAGAIGFLGIGHFYVGKIRRGLILLIGAWVLAGTSFFCFVVWSMSHMVIPPPGYPEVELPTYASVALVIGVVLLFGIAALWIWQIFDARAACQEYNKQISE